MTLPNFLIIGAPKCGTSSLYNWMLLHPEICGALVKEPFFLMDPEHPIQGNPAHGSHGLEAWSRHFPADAARFPIRMEATTHYLFQRTALEVAKSLQDMRICIVLRDPAVRTLSSFNYTQNNLLRLDSGLDFDAFLELARSGGSLYPRYCSDRRSAFVLEHDLSYSHYSDWVERWLDALGHDRVRVVIFEELVASPHEKLAELFAWLGIAPRNIDPQVMSSRNITYKVKRRHLHKLALMMNPFLRALGPVKPQLRNLYVRLQGAKCAEPPAINLDPLRQDLFRDVRRLEALLNRDLSIWYPDDLKRCPSTAPLLEG